MSKTIRIGKALLTESLKRLPYVGFILIVIVLLQVYVTGGQVAENVRISRQNSDANNVLLAKISGLSEDNKKLSQDNKALSEQNNSLADQSNRYLDCIAQLFAKYTRDYKPIIITDLNICAAQNIEQKTSVPITPSSNAQSTPTPAMPTIAPAKQSKKGIFNKLFRLPNDVLNKLRR